MPRNPEIAPRNPEYDFHVISITWVNQLRTHSAAEVSTMRFPNGVLSVCPELYIFGDIADLGPWKEDHGSQSVL